MRLTLGSSRIGDAAVGLKSFLKAVLNGDSAPEDKPLGLSSTFKTDLKTLLAPGFIE
jgi:hypothetical protein